MYFVLINELIPGDKGMKQKYKVPQQMEQGLSFSAEPIPFTSFQYNSNQFNSIPCNSSQPNTLQIQLNIVQHN